MFTTSPLIFIVVVATVPIFLFTPILADPALSTSCELYKRHDQMKNICVDYEWCLYKFYAKTKSWFDAKAICEEGNMTLAHITTTSNHSYLYNLMRNSLPTLFVSPPSSVWVGAYRTAGGEAKWHGGCSGVDTHVLGGVDNSKEACFLLADSNTLKTESCSTSLPFLCQSSSLEINNCFTGVDHKSDVAAVNGAFFGIRSPLDCYPSCVLDIKCVGFRHNSPECTLFTLCPGSSLAKGILFMKDLLRTAVPNSVKASISDLQNICFTSVAAPSHDTSSITPTQTFSITPTKTFSSTILSTVSTSTSTLMDPSYLESSSPEPVTVMKTYSDSTPPLSSVFTSVNLEKTSLPTETETLSMSCSNCACTKSSSMDQEELEESISKLKEQLSVNPKELSSFKRKLTSASDDRQSAANIGYVGALILCIIPGFVILLDMGRLTREFKQFISRLRNPHRATANVAPLKRT